MPKFKPMPARGCTECAESPTNNIFPCLYFSESNPIKSNEINFVLNLISPNLLFVIFFIYSHILSLSNFSSSIYLFFILTTIEKEFSDIGRNAIGPLFKKI